MKETNQKLSRNKFRKAMELIESGENRFCCHALGWISSERDTKEAVAFRKIFELEDGQTFVNLARVKNIPLDYDLLKDLRLMALAMAEAVLFHKDRQ